MRNYRIGFEVIGENNFCETVAILNLSVPDDVSKEKVDEFLNENRICFRCRRDVKKNDGKSNREKRELVIPI